MLANKLKISLKEIAYIGDDINDIEVLQHVGFSGVPTSAPEYIKTLSTLKLSKKEEKEFLENL